MLLTVACLIVTKHPLAIERAKVGLIRSRSAATALAVLKESMRELSPLRPTQCMPSAVLKPVRVDKKSSARKPASSQMVDSPKLPATRLQTVHGGKERIGFSPTKSLRIIDITARNANVWKDNDTAALILLRKRLAPRTRKNAACTASCKTN